MHVLTPPEKVLVEALLWEDLPAIRAALAAVSRETLASVALAAAAEEKVAELLGEPATDLSLLGRESGDPAIEALCLVPVHVPPRTSRGSTRECVRIRGGGDRVRVVPTGGLAERSKWRLFSFGSTSPAGRAVTWIVGLPVDSP